MERKVQKTFIYRGFGFPVTLHNVPMIKNQGSWVPDVDPEDLAAQVYQKLKTENPNILSAKQVKFLRQFRKKS